MSRAARSGRRRWAWRPVLLALELVFAFGAGQLLAPVVEALLGG
jgi:hypothetical protein